VIRPDFSKDGVIYIGGLHDARVVRRTQGVLGITEAQGRLLSGKQLPTGDGIGGGTGEKHVAAAAIELPRESVEAAHGPVGLHGVGVLFEPYPSSIAGRLLRSEHSDSAADITCRYPGDLL
jgi:hypothetical protein